MRYSQSTFQSRIYLEFLEIASNEYRAIVQYFEDNLEDIKLLHFDEYFELLLAYLDGLFQLRHFQSYLKRVDVAIEATILRNIKHHHGFNVYERLLFRKATALYNVMEYQKAEYILKELLKMNPNKKKYADFLRKCLNKAIPGFIHKTRAVSVILFFLSAFIISIEILLIRQFYEVHHSDVQILRNITFCLGWIVLLGGEAIHRMKVKKRVSLTVENIKVKKQVGVLS